MSVQENTVIMGAGLAGLITGLILSRRGLPVLLIEAGPRVGGKLQSWVDPDGDVVEHGCHIWWDQYRNFHALLESFDLADRLVPLPRSFALIRANGEYTLVTPEWLNDSYGLASFAMRLPGLGFGDKLSAILGGLRMLGFEFGADYAALDTVSFRTWAKESGFSEAVLNHFFNTIIPSHFYLPLHEVSAAAILSGRPNYFSSRTQEVSVLVRPPQEALLEPMVRAIKQLGGRLLLQTKVLALEQEGQLVRAIDVESPTGTHERIEPRYVVSGLDVNAFQRVAQPLFSACNDLAGVPRLDATPVICARIWLHERLPAIPATVGHFQGSALLHTFFHISAFQPEFAGEGDLLEVQSGPAQEYIHLNEDILKQLILDEMSRFWPQLLNAGLRKIVVIKHQKGFTSFRVGSERYRPCVQTSLKNLWLAGDWVRVPTPVFAMERTALSAILAANEILAREALEPWPVFYHDTAREDQFQSAASYQRLVKRVRRKVLKSLGYESAL
jgi:15-cis-phytoene desaturase